MPNRNSAGAKGSVRPATCSTKPETARHNCSSKAHSHHTCILVPLDSKHRQHNGDTQRRHRFIHMAFSYRYQASKHVQHSPGARKQKHKKSGPGSPGSRSVQKTRVTFQNPLATAVIEHIESCIHTATLLLRHCKNAKFPSTKLSNLKSLRRNILEEERATQELDETMNSLDGELQKAIANANASNDSITDQEEKIDSLKQKVLESDDFKIITSKSDALQLPKASYQAPTMQEYFKSLKNPSGLLKELGVMQYTPVADEMRRVIENCYAEIDAL
uniref:Centromere protein Q n=1 Tax=Leptobrachium leishanense TaxID=445787 RepID=A0A8C5Q5F3_9ANUR